MKNLFLAGLVVFLTINIYSQNIVKVGTNGSYTSLRNAFTEINNGNLTGEIEIQIISSTTETSSAIINASGVGGCNYSSIVIYPTTSNLKIEGNMSSPLITFNGADNIIIDGRVNRTGSTADLTIVNYSTSSSSSTSTLQFKNSAENNTVQYSYIKGAETNLISGIVYFYQASSGNGNDKNTIDNNFISGTSDVNRPINAVYSNGTINFANSENVISNNRFYNFLNRGFASNGINVYANSTDWVISGNSFYETTTFEPSVNVEYGIIRIYNNSGSNFTVTNNYIGGSSEFCGSSSWKKSYSANNVFKAIYISVGNTAISNVQNNTIRNIEWSNSQNASWYGIEVAAGLVNVGTLVGNTIGEGTGTGSIHVNNKEDGANIFGINLTGTGVVGCQNNIIASVTSGNLPNYATNFYGIHKASGGGTTNISFNTIGSNITSNSIQINSTSEESEQKVYAILNEGGGIVTMQNNIIANIKNGTTNPNPFTSGLISGIASTAGTNVISDNIIHDLSIANANNSLNNVSVSGIFVSGSNARKTISKNQIFNLYNTNANFEGSVTGVLFASTNSNHTVSENYIHSLFTSVEAAGSSIYGIKIMSGITTYSNNLIHVGKNTTGTVYGIFDNGSASQASYVYFNTIYIDGVLESGNTNKSYGLFSNGFSNTRNFRNNIFVNTRSTSESQNLHYAVYYNYAATTSLTTDFNNYFTTGTGGTLGYFDNTNINTIPVIQGQDLNSLNINPGYNLTGANNTANFTPSSDKLAGVSITGFTNDFSATSRAYTPTMGIFETTLNLNLDVYVSGVYQATYLKLKDAFDRINNGFHKGQIEIRIKANTSEQSTAVLYQKGYNGTNGLSDYTSIQIYPVVSGLTISGSISGALIEMNGAGSLIIDGRVNKTGDVSDLTLNNKSTNLSASTVQFINSAENNILRYCNIKGSETGSSKGIITFSTAATGNGNSNNSIDHNNISGNDEGRPMNAIYSFGSTNYENKENTLSNNNIFNILRTTSSTIGINISTGSASWTISNNSFYETEAVIPSVANTYNFIRVGTTNSHLVKNNYIGGSGPLCSGTPMTIGASLPVYFIGIYIGSGTIASVIENNTIKNIRYTSTNSNPWDGIYINNGNVDIKGNTIGETTGNNSIIITTPVASAYSTIANGVVTSVILNGGGSGYTIAPKVSFSTSGSTITAAATVSITNGEVTGFTITDGGSGYTSAPTVMLDAANYSTSHGIRNFSAGIVNISNNSIGSITTVGSNTYSHGFESIILNGAAATATINNNLIGSLSTPNSIYTSSTATNSLMKQDIFGIYSLSTGIILIKDNTIANLTNGCTGNNSSTRTRGIATTTGTNTIKNNTVRDITAINPQVGNGANASMIGIAQTSTTGVQIVEENTVYNLKSLNSSAKLDMYGIYFSGINNATNSISRNFVHSLYITTTDISSSIYGIWLYTGVTTCSNNIVSVGTGITKGYKIYGIYDQSGTGSNTNIIYNTVYIGGSISSGTTSSTFALYNANNGTLRNYKNNILANTRTGGSTGKHYGIKLSGITNLQINHNMYYAPNGVLGIISSDIASILQWQTATGMDANSVSVNPNLSNPGGVNALDYIGTHTLGEYDVNITKDFLKKNRTFNPSIGAFELLIEDFIWTGGNSSSDWNTEGNWLLGNVPTASSNVKIPGGTTFQPVNYLINSPIECHNITIEEGATLTLVSNSAMTVYGDLINNGTFEIKSSATGDGSLIVKGEISGNGSFQVERYLTKKTWHFVSSPIISANAGVFNGQWLRFYDESVNNWGAYILNETTLLPQMEGFSVWSNENISKTFVGKISNNTVTKTLSRTQDGDNILTRGWNLIGNPYTSAIDLDNTNGWQKNDIANAVYMWDGNLNKGQYRVYLTKSGSNFSGISVNAGSQYVSMGQGFFVFAKTNGASITMTKEIQVHNEVSFKNQATAGDIIKIEIGNNIGTDESIVYVSENASNDFDYENDAAKLYGSMSIPQVYTKKSDDKLTINAINNLENLNNLLVYVEVGEAGEYNIHFNNPTENNGYFLRDLVTNANILPGQQYYFTANPTDDPARFEFVKNITTDIQTLETQTDNLMVWENENILYVNSQNAEQVKEISIYNSLGSLVLFSNEKQTNIDNLPTGVYIVKVSTTHQTISKRIFVK